MMKNLSYLFIHRLKYHSSSIAVSIISRVQTANRFLGRLMLVSAGFSCQRQTNYFSFRVNACDKEEKYQGLVEEFTSRVNTL